MVKWFLAEILAFGVTLAVAARNPLQTREQTAGGIAYDLGNVTYFVNTQYAKATLPGKRLRGDGDMVPMTVIVSNQSVITGEYLQGTIAEYLAGDDVFSEDFLGSLYLSSTIPNSSLDFTALRYLKGLGLDHLFLDSNVFSYVPASSLALPGVGEDVLPSGPYTAIIADDTIRFLDTYRLYRDEYRDFITGAYPSNDGTGSFTALELMSSKWWNAMIPVPSRIHYWRDSRPLAGTRVAVKDLFDMKGLQTSAGSQAWVRITPFANSTAPAIQRLIDLGAVLVGKYKLAQFASGANPWDWTDEHYPFNPRGDGYLTCSASSSGGGCSVAAYPWLDNAIGSDTGSSMRRPAAVSGTFGNRPSQGMISLDGAIALSWPQDTAGVFARDPYQWAKFAKAWYTPELYQDSAITGLSPLSVPETSGFPKRILYPDEYLPLANPAAQAILDRILANMTQLFNMTANHVNLTATVANASIFANASPAANWETLSNATSAITAWSQRVAVAGPLTTAWAEMFDGRFPPVDPQWRASWTRFDASKTNQTTYDAALRTKATGVQWFEENVLAETPESCSESMLICDIGTGGLPSFRERDLNDNANASFLAVLPPGAAITCANICPFFGCADFTIPLGQVSYQSPVTMVTEQYPVSINMIVRRGCDFMLFDMVEKLADAGVIQAVKTGRTAF